MRSYSFLLILLLLLTNIPVCSSQEPLDENRNPESVSFSSTLYPQLASPYTVLVHLNYFMCDPDLDPWIAGDPDPYFVVHVEEHYQTTAVYNGMNEIYLNLNFTFTIYPKNPVILVRIEAWDDDFGLTFGDDEIDIDANVGTALDLWYNLITKTWCGDTNTTLARGDAQNGWGKLAFYIDSEPLSPLQYGKVHFSYLNTENVYIDGVLKSVFKNSVKDYQFSVSASQTIEFNFFTSQAVWVTATIYRGTETIGSHSFTGFWQTSFYATPGNYGVKIICNSGSGTIEIGFCVSPFRALPSASLDFQLAGNVELIGKGSNAAMLRMFGLSGVAKIKNTGSIGGTAFIGIRNLEPDMFEFINATTIALGRNIALLSVSLAPGETKTVEITPWYAPDDYWYVFMSDSQPPFTIPPGGNVEQSVHFINIINQTNLVNPPFILHAGDIVDGLGYMDEDHMYGTGYTSPVNDYEYGEAMEALSYLQNFIALAVGNHDVSRGHIQGLGEAHYKEWIAPLYYSFTYRNLQVIVIDTYEDQDSWWFVGNTGMYGGYIYGSQKDWLYNEIASTTKPVRVAVMHHPLALPPNPNPAWTFNETFFNRSNALEIFRLFSGNISQLYCGHIHDYIAYNLTETQNDVVSTSLPGLQCIIAGNAGGDLDKRYCPYYGFVMVHLNGSQIVEHTFIREDQFRLSITYNTTNDGSASEIRANIVNTGAAIPWIRLKFIVSGEYEQYMAYSLAKNASLPAFSRKFGNYTVVYVHLSSIGSGTESVVVSPLRGVEIDMPRTVIVLPNSTVLVAHNITNTGCIAETVKLEVYANLTGWNVTIVDVFGNTISEIYIPAHGRRTIFVRIYVPENATDGEVCGILLNASVKDMPWIYSTVVDEAHCVVALYECNPLPFLVFVAFVAAIRKSLVLRYRS